MRAPRSASSAGLFAVSAATAAVAVVTTTATPAVANAGRSALSAQASRIPAVAALPRATGPDSSLTTAVRNRMAASTASSWSVVVDIAGRGRVVSVGSGKALLPASTEKLFTTLPILLNSPSRSLWTSFGSTQAPSRAVLHGDLVLVSSGDPTLTGNDIRAMAQKLYAAGVHKVTGRLVLDIRSLPTTRVRSGWKSSYVPGDVAPLSPFPLGGDSWNTSSGYVANPTGRNLAWVRGALARAGVSIAGDSVLARHVAMSRVFVSHASAPLKSIVRTTLLASVNFYAEQLLSIERRSAVDAVESKAGATANYATDGSGLSLKDTVTTAAQVALLKYAASSPAGSALHASLPVACTSGTLKNSLCDSATRGKVVAKTGTLNTVKALAGYTTDGAGRAVTFAILTNGDRSTTSAMAAIQKALDLVCNYTG